MEGEVSKYGESFTVKQGFVENYWMSNLRGVNGAKGEDGAKSTNQSPPLSKAERDHLNKICPFYIANEEYGVVKIVQVSRKYFITEQQYNIAYSSETVRYKDMDSLDDYGKRIHAKIAKDFFEAHGEKYREFLAFSKENPEYFI